MKTKAIPIIFFIIGILANGCVQQEEKPTELEKITVAAFAGEICKIGCWKRGKDD